MFIQTWRATSLHSCGNASANVACHVWGLHSKLITPWGSGNKFLGKSGNVFMHANNTEMPKCQKDTIKT
ncbi:MAG: hypothetical protein HDS84_04045 [Bacteroidales bacterium]|nr:hypothetical protein [Bacteroidales bacterium]